MKDACAFSRPLTKKTAGVGEVLIAVASNPFPYKGATPAAAPPAETFLRLL